jgi:hypothetical protein
MKIWASPNNLNADIFIDLIINLYVAVKTKEVFILVEFFRKYATNRFYGRLQIQTNQTH